MQSRSRSLAFWASLLLTALTMACNPLDDFQAPCIDLDGGGCNPGQVVAPEVLPSNASGG